jgi:16S rRNA (uracil1498-N3)-methyltransferase
MVLRKKVGEKINLVDGRGHLFECVIEDDHKKHARARVENLLVQTPPARKCIIGISLLKNASRFEWFLEKATEIGITEIVPLLCERTERQKFRKERLEQVITSAMLQSQQSWKPLLHEPVAFTKIFKDQLLLQSSQRFIAHCLEEEKRSLADLVNASLPSQLILIGPEGDFTPVEIALALEHHFIAVSLGETRLRAETAGMFAAVILKAAG